MAKSNRKKPNPPAESLKEEKRLKKEKRAKAAREKRKKINENPIEKAKAQMKQHLRYEKGKQDGKILLMKDLSKKEQVALRKKGRVNYRLRQRRKIIEEENDVVQASINVKAEVSSDVDIDSEIDLENTSHSSQDLVIGGSSVVQSKVSVASTSTSQNQICDNNDFKIDANNLVERRTLKRIIWH